MCNMRHCIVVSVRVSGSFAELCCCQAGACGQCRTFQFYSGFVQLCEICILKYLGNSKVNWPEQSLEIAIRNTAKCFGVYRAH